jgi:hypothetical protein
MKKIPLYIAFILFLAVILLLSGCVSPESEKSELESAPPGLLPPDLQPETLTVPAVLAVPTTPELRKIIIDNKDSNRENCGENLCPSGWHCCTNLELCYQGQKPLNCNSSETKNPQFFPTPSGDVVSAVKQSSIAKPDSYPACVKMPDGSMNCPDYSGNYKAVPTASTLSKAIGN